MERDELLSFPFLRSFLQLLKVGSGLWRCAKPQWATMGSLYEEKEQRDCITLCSTDIG